MRVKTLQVSTIITLNHKVSNLEHLSEFSPLNLCNVIMRMISMAIANRVKRVLPGVVGEQQSASVLGHLITDNALMAFEAFHHLKKKTKGKKDFMALN